MLRRLIAVAALAAGMSIAAAVTLATPAFAKGPSQARITGPGLVRAIVVSGNGEPGEQGRLANLAEQTGLFTVMFGAGVTGPGASPAAHAPAGGLPRPAVHARLHGARRHTAAGPAVRAGPPGPLPACGRWAGHLHATRPAGLRRAPDGHRMAPGPPAADPHAGPARRSAVTGHTGSAAGPPRRGRTSGGGAASGPGNPRLDHRAGRGHRGRGAHRHRVVAAPPQAGRPT